MLKLQTYCIVFLFCAVAVIPSPAQRISFSTLASFDGDNGAQPYSSLIQGADGNVYGTTGDGGANGSNAGTVFKITAAGTLNLLYTFGSHSTDGSYPYAGLVQATDGNFYGTTATGGGNLCVGGCGTVFRISSAGAMATLHRFDYFDGAWPFGGLVQATDGDFYGTTIAGGANGKGTVFKITPAGALTTLYSFCAGGFPCADGDAPQAGLVLARDGNFYGTTKSMYGYGTVFKITPAGTLTTLHSFAYTDGANPEAALVEGSDGNFYGTTYRGGSPGYGTVFRITPAGTLTTLYNFAFTDGDSPLAALVEGSDGNFYGTTCEGGTSRVGTVFKITAAGELTTLHSFDGADGAYPWGGLLQAPNGFFYGTTSVGGAYGDGTVYRLGVARSCATCRP